jgi:UDP-glucose 4-epimerase
MRVVVTGGAGFIGSSLVRELLRVGESVAIIDDLSTGYLENIAGLPVDFVEASILSDEALDSVLVGSDSVVHLAALGSVPRSIANPSHTHEVNATGTLRVLEACRRNQVGHVIVASSSSVYGMNPNLPKRERDWVRPMSPYAVSKLTTEQYALAYQQSFGLSTLAFRFFNVYGPRQRAGHVYAAVIPLFIDALLKGRPLQIHGDGTQSRDFTYVGTVCNVIREAIHIRASYPEPVNLAFGTNTSILDLVRQIKAVAGASPLVEFTPPRKGDVPHSQADNTQLLSMFPEIDPVDLTTGLEQTLQWFKENS